MTTSRPPVTHTVTRLLIHLILLTGVTIMILPFLYMVGTSFKPPPEVIAWPPTLIPRNPTLANYALLRTAAPFGRFFLNSVIMSTSSTLGILVTCQVLALLLFFSQRQRLLASAD